MNLFSFCVSYRLLNSLITAIITNFLAAEFSLVIWYKRDAKSNKRV
jgi:hypothetical protein